MNKIELMSGWTLVIEGPGDFEIANFGPDGERRFYVIEPGPYSPIIREEPELALELGEDKFVDAQGNPAARFHYRRGTTCFPLMAYC
jgi:hypothetical protein